MKGMRMKNAIVDSDISDDDADDLDIDKLTKSIQQVQLDDNDDGFEDDDDDIGRDYGDVSFEDDISTIKSFAKASTSNGLVPSRVRSYKQSIGTLTSLTGDSSSEEDTELENDDESVHTISNKKMMATTQAFTVAGMVATRPRLSSLSDSDAENGKTQINNKKNQPFKKPLPVTKPFNILDDSSSSDSDDSFNEFLRSSSRTKAHLPKQGMTSRPLKKKPQKSFGNDSDSLGSATEQPSKATAKKNEWSFNKIRSEYSIGGDGRTPPFSLPSKLYDMLFDFQKDGVFWMAGLHLGRIGGCLGDDMGMGKTFMTLSLLGGFMRAKTIRKALVVAPVSVLRNWENEARRILGMCVKTKIQVIASEASKYAREKKLKEALEAQTPQLVITTLGLVSSSPDQFQHRRYSWDYIIVDEAHRIKNPNAQVSQNIELIAKRDETRRLILTGTPIMNNLKELHSLFTFCTSGKLLGNQRDFQDNFGAPIEAARSSDATDWEVERGENAMKELQRLLHPYFLQRLKVDYLAECLPPKKEYVLWTNLSPLQRTIYNDYVTSKDSGLADYLSGRENSPLFAITWLQKLCGHPLLVRDADGDPPQPLQDIGAEELLRQSAKLKVMYDLVHSLRENSHRTLIFSQSTKVLDIIQYVLKDTVKLGRIDGQTKEKDRQRFVDEFNNPESTIEAMLISTKAGGQGLTLTGADTVIVYDPSWNPAEDSQAVDRCYRIGQKKPVTVYRLITSGTVEEKRYEKQIHKDGLRRTILTSTGNDTAKYFTKEELLRRQVFVLGEEGHCEFLKKLTQRGFNSLEDIDPDAIFSDGVVGQSSHDIVYSLPENWDKDEESLDAPAPFSSPSTKGTWYETKNEKIKQKMVVGRSQRVLLQNEITEGRGKPEKENDGSGMNHQRVMIDRTMQGGPLRPKQSTQSFDEQMDRVKQLRASGNDVKAVACMMDMLNDSYDGLSSDEKMKLHQEIADSSNGLKWL